MTASLLFTQATSSASGSGTAAIFVQMAPLLLIFVIFYFLLIRPQQKRMRDHATKVAAAKRGDTVVTGGGLIGKVTKVTDDEAEVEIATGVKVRVVKSTLSDVLNTTAKPAND